MRRGRMIPELPSIGGYASARALTKAQRQENARRAITARWKKRGARKKHAETISKSWEKRRQKIPGGSGWTYQTPPSESAM